MAIKDTTKKPYIIDRDEEIFVGIDLPFRKSEGIDGWFASTTTTIEAVKNNIRNLLQTNDGERFFQPTLGVDLRQYMFEQVSDDIVLEIQNDILNKFAFWLPFVEVRDIEVSFKQVDSEKNNINLSIVFNIKQDPNTTDSIQLEIGE